MTEGLKNEKGGWVSSLKDFESRLACLDGDILLSCGILT